MNHLNSVLLEGDIADTPTELKTIDGEAACTFMVNSKHYRKDGDAIKEEVTRVPIRATGRLANNCFIAFGLDDNGGVRVVGHLASDDELGLIVVAEHVEFKPRVKTDSAGKEVAGGGYS